MIRILFRSILPFGYFVDQDLTIKMKLVHVVTQKETTAVLSEKKISCWVIFAAILYAFSSSNWALESAVVNEVAAQDQAIEDEKILVVTATRIESDLTTLASNTHLLEKETLELIGHTHINEVLTRVPGVWISRGNGQEHLTAVRSPVFTGPGSCGEFLMLEDGVPLRATGFCNVNQLFDANTEQADRIEVVRGANSAIYGSNAVHGMINIISPNPGHELNKASFEFGPHDYLRLKTAHHHANQGQNSTQSFLLNFNATHDDGYKDASGFEQQKMTFKHVLESPVIDVTSSFSASNLDQETAGFLQQGTNAYREDRYRRTNDFPEAFRTARSFRFQSQISNSSDSWRLTPYARSNDMEFLMHFLPGQPIENNGHDSVGILWQSIHQWNDGVFIWGVDSEYTRGYLEQFQSLPTDSGSAFLDEVLPQGFQYDYRVNAKAAAFYANWASPINEHWSYKLATRFDYQSFDYDNLMLDGNTRDDGSECGFGGCRYTRPSNRKDNFDDFSFALSLSYQIEPDLLSYWKIDRAFRAPQTTELYRLQNGQLESEVDSEQVESVEAGLRGTSSNYFFDISLFHMEKKNVIFQNSDREFVSGAETQHQGMEASLKLALNQNWTVTANTSYARHQYSNNVDLRGTGNFEIKGNIIDTAPELQMSLQLAWRPSESIHAEIEWAHTDEYYTNPENTHFYEGHDLFNFRLKNQWTSNWSGFLRITNLSDENYAERADFAFGNDRYFVGEPRTLYLGVEGVIE